GGVLTKTLTLMALSLGAFVGVGLNVYGMVAGIFSPQQRVAQQNDRISGAIGLLGNAAFADAPSSCASCSSPSPPPPPPSRGCSSTGGCGGGCGCGGCG